MAPLYALFEISLVLARRFGRPPATIGAWPAASSGSPSPLSVALPAGASASVLYVGDSLGVGTSPYLRQQLDGVAISVDAEIGRPSGAGVDVLRSEIAPRARASIFDLGTNDDPAAPDGAGRRPRRGARDRRRPLPRRRDAQPPAAQRGLRRRAQPGRDLVREPRPRTSSWSTGTRAAADDPGMLDRRRARDGRRLRAARRPVRRRDRLLLATRRLRLAGSAASGAVGAARARDAATCPRRPRRGSNTAHGERPARDEGPSRRERRVRAVAEEVGRAVGDRRRVRLSAARLAGAWRLADRLRPLDRRLGDLARSRPAPRP